MTDGDDHGWTPQEIRRIGLIMFTVGIVLGAAFYLALGVI